MGGSTASGRRQQEGRAGQEGRREGLQGRARANTRAQGKIRSVGRDQARGCGQGSRRYGQETENALSEDPFARSYRHSVLSRFAGLTSRMRMLPRLFALLLFAARPRSAGSIGAAMPAARGFHRSTRSRRPMSIISCAHGNSIPAISAAVRRLAMARTKFEATPLFVEDSLVLCSPFNEVIALDPGSGEQKWRYDPRISQRAASGQPL